MRVPEAVIYDLDGVLTDSEQLWTEAKQALVRERGGQWRDAAGIEMMGMSSPEWSAFMRDELGVPLSAEEINAGVVGWLAGRYRRELPLIPGAVESVRAIAQHYRVGLASSANREVIDLVLTESGLADVVAVSVSSEEVALGKPSPDVYLEVVSRLGVAPDRSLAIEDSSNGLRAAVAAGLTAIAVPNPHYPPDAAALALAIATVTTVAEVTPALIERVSG